jgi:DNA-binding transcriptional ArsR family regulator
MHAQMKAKLVDIDDPRLVKALAHPIRMKILNILDNRTATPKELAEILGLPLENVSYHVRTLKDFGFIKLEKTRQVRGAVEHHYKLAARPQIGQKLWNETPRVVQEALTDAHLGVTIEDVGHAALQGLFDDPSAHIARYSLALGAEEMKEADKVLKEAYDKLEALSAKAQKRGGDDVRDVTCTVLLYEKPEPMAAEAAAKKRDVSGRRRAQKSNA